ncbi:MAG: TIGR03546 family protein [Gemmatimonadota bacterium]
MLAILKLLQSLFKTLHSDGSPSQVAAGVALGACLGLTPLLNLHNLVVFALIVILNVSFGGGMLGWAIFTPIGFLLDPLFDRLGHLLLLDSPALRPLWLTWFNSPWVPYTNFNNTVVLGSFVSWVLLFVPILFLSRWALIRYRATLGERVRQSRFYQVVTASRAYNVYRWFRPE